MRAGESRRPAAGQRGFTLWALLVLMATTLLAVSAAGPMWSQQAQRERERELVRIGGLYAQALARYRALSPGSDKHYPERLQDLTLDTRFVGTMRHLRRLYPDPVNRGMPWVPVKDAQGRIIGVRSASLATPVAERPLDINGRPMPPARRYADWVFTPEERS